MPDQLINNQIYGFRPFLGNDQAETFDLVKAGKFTFPTADFKVGERKPPGLIQLLLCWLGPATRICSLAVQIIAREVSSVS